MKQTFSMTARANVKTTVRPRHRVFREFSRTIEEVVKRDIPEEYYPQFTEKGIKLEIVPWKRVTIIRYKVI